MMRHPESSVEEALKDSMGQRLLELRFLADESTGEEQVRLRKQLKEAQNYLDKELSEPTSLVEAQDIVSRLEDDSGIFERYAGKGFDYIDIETLSKSSLAPFVGIDNIHALNAAAPLMIGRDNFNSTLQSTPGGRFKEAARAGIDYLKGAIRNKWKPTDSEINSQVRKSTFDIESRNAKERQLRNAVPQNVLNDVEGLTTQLQSHRIEQLQAFMKKELIEAYEIVESEDSFSSNKERVDYKLRLQEIEGQLPNSLTSANPDFKNALLGIEEVKNDLKSRIETANSVSENRETLESRLSEAYKIIKTESLIGEMSSLSDHELHRELQEAERLAAKAKTLDYEDGPIKLTSQLKEAILARNCLNEIANAETADDIISALGNTIGVEKITNHIDEGENVTGNPAKHAKIIPTAEFERYRNKGYTEGKMVTYKRGDVWYVLIDEAILFDPESVSELKKQITHELLQVEFEAGGEDENNNAVKAAALAWISQDPEKWITIQNEFKQLGKTPPTGNEWNEHSILSELYGMQNELGNRFFDEPSTALERLNNLMLNLGKPSLPSGISERYNKDEEAQILGYEEGIGDLGDSDDGSNSAGSSVESGTSASQSLSKIDSLDEQIDIILKSPYIGSVPGAVGILGQMKTYNENSRRIANSGSTATLDQRTKQVEDDLGQIKELLEKTSGKAPNGEMGLFGQMWLNTKFHSIADMVQMGRDLFEFVERRRKRRNASGAASLGSAFFGKSAFGRESVARDLKAEAEEVGEWKNRYEGLSADQLEDVLGILSRSFSPDRDQLKAVLQLLASKGRIDWRSEDLWKVLNKIQGATEFKIGDKSLLGNTTLLSEKMSKAFSAIYDEDEYPSLERDNESNFNGAMDKYNPTHERTATRLSGRIGDLLEQYMNGETIDPILYASLIKYCISQGRSNAELITYHMMVGIAKGILSPDFGVSLSGLAGTWPPIDWFGTVQPNTKEQFEKICKEMMGDNYAAGWDASSNKPVRSKKFTTWFWTEIQNSEAVKSRAQKTVAKRSWDPDWGRTAASLGDHQDIKTHLSGRSGQQEASQAVASNTFVSLTQWLDENSIDPKKASRDDFARMAANSMMAESILNRTAYYKGQNDIAARGSEAMDSKEPGEAYAGRHGGQSLGVHRGIVNKFLLDIDKGGLFNVLLSAGQTTGQANKDLAAKCMTIVNGSSYYAGLDLGEIKDSDDIFNKLDLITSFLFSEKKMNDAAFIATLENYRDNISGISK